jgi:hypothetical protein
MIIFIITIKQLLPTFRTLSSFVVFIHAYPPLIFLIIRLANQATTHITTTYPIYVKINAKAHLHITEGITQGILELTGSPANT